MNTKHRKSLLLFTIHSLAIYFLAIPCYATDCGIDVIVATRFQMFVGKKIVLVSHAAARARSGKTTAELFTRQTDLKLLRILAPEHGFHGIINAGANVDDGVMSGITVVSLYGAKRKPDSAMIGDADVVVIDLQDIGIRSYTYISTMAEVMDACAEYNKPLVILDRPNPIGGNTVDGTLPDSSMVSFVARLPIPYVHGMTIGELATMANKEGWLNSNSPRKNKTCSLTVVKCKQWTRSMRWEDTGLHWYPTSPNIPTIESVRGCAVTGLAGELGLFSIGIGSATPFCVIGSPEFHKDSLLEFRLSKYGVVPRYGLFQPSIGKYSKQICSGYFLAFETGSTLMPFKAAIALIATTYASRRSLNTLDETAISDTERTKMFNKTIGSNRYLQMLLQGSAYAQLDVLASRDRAHFLEKRKPYLLY